MARAVGGSSNKVRRDHEEPRVTSKRRVHGTLAIAARSYGMNVNPEIIARLKQARWELAMSPLMQARLAEGIGRHALATACDMEPEVLELIERNEGVARPSRESRMCLARVLRVAEEKLFPPH